MESVNSFSKGLNQDIDSLLQNNETYYDALNIRLITENGSTTPSITNIRGNDFKLEIPNTTNVRSINITNTGAVNITINSQTGAGLTITSSTTNEDIYNYIVNDSAYTNCVNNIGFTGLNANSYNIYYNDEYILLVGSIFNNLMNTVTTTVSNASILNLNNSYIPAQTNLRIIGSTFIRDNIYLFTTNNTTDNPGGQNINLPSDTSSVGQIWELIYDIINENYTLKLIYNNYVDFTTQHPIPRSAVEGRYENSLTQRIYWTDNFNKLRSINVKDENAFALDVTLLDIKPSINFSRPSLQKIVTGGILKVGVYESCYRLKNNGGSVTKFSPISNTVNIVETDESIATGGANFSNYHGNNINTPTNKAINWLIEDIDNDYERIEVLVIHRDILTNIPSFIKIIKDEPIPANGIFNFTYTGNEETVDISLDELNALDDTFTHCKTLSTKDNRLVVGNIRSQLQELDYDSRAYRFPISSTNFDITENTVVNSYNSTTWNTIDETSDAINSNISTQKYKENSTVIGGSGPNINYEFGTIAVKSDSTIELVSPATAPFRHTNPDFIINQLSLNVKKLDSVNNQTYPLNNINDDIKYPYIASLLKGYQSGEKYRFGITFYDKEGNPLYVKWIGDIIFPEHNDVCPSSNALFEDGSLVPLSAYTGSLTKDFRPSFIHNKVGIVESFVNQIYIKFEVNIPDSLSKLISGYSISRLERENEDKTILGTGILTQVVSDGGSLFLPDTQEFENGCPTTHPGFINLNINDSNRSNAGEASNYTPTFECPEFLLNNYPGYNQNDKIKVIAKLNIENSLTSINVNSGVEPYFIYKYYDIEQTYSNVFDIEEAGTVDLVSSYTFNGTTNNGWTFYNYTRTTANTSSSLGSKTLALGLDSEIEFNTTYGCSESNGKKLIAQYVRTVTNQYGGDTYNARSNNEYIQCSHFRPIDNYITTTGTLDDFIVFGGDVYSQIYDNQRSIKNWGQTSRGQYSSGSGCTPGTNKSKASVTFYFPCVASHNTDLRHGNHVNKDLDNDTGTKASAYETHNYNLSYNNINNIKRYFSKSDLQQLVSEYDNRIWASEIKTNGERIDSWSIFKSENYWDVEGTYGQLNSLNVLQDKMLFFQDRAFGLLSINPRSLINDDSGLTLQLGTGDVIQRHDYISTENGTKHQWSVLNSSSTVLFWDSNKRKIMRFRFGESGLNSLSDIKGLRGYLFNNTSNELIVNDNPLYFTNFQNFGCGVHGVYDYRYNEFIITFNDVIVSYNGSGEPVPTSKSFTICFNEEIDAFTSFYSFTPNIYITNHREILSSNELSKQDLYLHDKGDYCNFYNVINKSKVNLIINENPKNTKVFDNLTWFTESLDTDINITKDTWDRLRVYNSYQNTDYRDLIIDDNIKIKDRRWQTIIPRNRVLYTTNDSDIFNDLSLINKNYGERIRDKFIHLDLEYDNNDNYNLIFKLLSCKYRISAR